MSFLFNKNVPSVSLFPIQGFGHWAIGSLNRWQNRFKSVVRWRWAGIKSQVSRFEFRHTNPYSRLRAFHLQLSTLNGGPWNETGMSFIMLKISDAIQSLFPFGETGPSGHWIMEPMERPFEGESSAATCGRKKRNPIGRGKKFQNKAGMSFVINDLVPSVPPLPIHDSEAERLSPWLISLSDYWFMEKNSRGYRASVWTHHSPLGQSQAMTDDHVFQSFNGPAIQCFNGSMKKWLNDSIFQ